MTMIKKLALSIGAAAAAMAMSLSTHAATISYTGGQFTTFNGFDWAIDGTAFTTGFEAVTNDTFTLTYFATAIALRSPNTVPTGMDIIADGVSTGFGYTIVANLNERVTGCAFNNAICSFQIDAGSTFDIYYNPTLVANSLAGVLGTGYTLGEKIISGTVNVTGPLGGGTFTINSDGLGGSGSASLLGTVTYTNSAYIAPDLVGTVFGTQLNFGNVTTGWTNPGGFAGTPFNAGNIVFQADGNQIFSQAVPEPGSLALVSLALLGAGAVARRRKS